MSNTLLELDKIQKKPSSVTLTFISMGFTRSKVPTSYTTVNFLMFEIDQPFSVLLFTLDTIQQIELI